MFHQTMFFYPKLCIQHPGDGTLTQAVILSSTSNFFAPVAAFRNDMRPQVKNITDVYVSTVRHSL